jgi:hypothetical protein
MIRFACPTCQKVLKTSDNAVGRKIFCPRCTQSLVIPPPHYVQNKTILGKALPLDYPASAPAMAPSVNPVAPESALATPPSWMTSPPPVRTPLPASSHPPDAERILSEQLRPAELSDFANEEDATSSEEVDLADETDLAPARKHSVTGILSAVSAVLTFILFQLFCHIYQMEHPTMSANAVTTLRVVGCGIGLSSAVTCFIFAGLSLVSEAKKHLGITGCLFNLSLLIWILLRMNSL